MESRQVWRRDHPTDPPTCNGVGLAKAIHENAVVSQARQRYRGHVALAIENDMLVDFVSNQ